MSERTRLTQVAGACFLILGGVVGLLVLIFSMLAVAKWFSRYQARADANNKVKVTAIQIRNYQQRANVEKQKAQIRFIQSTGIRRAQDEIAKTLTPLYVQFEAVQAQLAMARSTNHTLIWVPSGDVGTPVIDPQRLAEESGAKK